VYHHLLDAVANVSVLSDSVQRFLDMPNSAQLAWGQSRSTLCAPLTACSRTSTAKLFTLSPKPKETMETFLNRVRAAEERVCPGMTLSSRTLT